MMNQQDIFRKLGTILDELNDQYAYLAENPEKLSDLEVELFLANANFLAEHAAIIKKLNEKTSRSATPETPAATGRASEQVSPLAAVSPAELDTPAHADQNKPVLDQVEELAGGRSSLDQDVFKPDEENQSFEFIINDRPSAPEADAWADKHANDSSDSPAADQETDALTEIATAEEDEARVDIQPERVPEGWEEEALTADEEDEIGPEPFLVSPNETAAPVWPAQQQPLKGSVPQEESDRSWPEQQVLAKGPVSDIGDMAHTPSAGTQPQPEAAESVPVRQPVPAAAAPVTELPAEDKKLNINELFARNREVGEKQQDSHQAPIGDLKQAISLNDKLLFIRELFNGYNLAYSEAIDLVNKMNSFETADAFLQKNYAAKNNWAAKQLTVDKLYELLRRRFPA